MFGHYLGPAAQKTADLRAFRDETSIFLTLLWVSRWSATGISSAISPQSGFLGPIRGHPGPPGTESRKPVDHLYNFDCFAKCKSF
jgi:hypothetical protein